MMQSSCQSGSFYKTRWFFHSSFFSLKNKLICLLNCVNMRLWSWKKRWRKNNPSYMIIISQQTFQQWVTVIFSQCLVLVKKKKKKKKRIVEWKLCQCWRNTFALCLVSFFDYLAIRKTSKILYFVKRQQPAKVTWTGVFLLWSPFLIPMRFISSAALCHNASVCLWTSCDYLFTTRNNISLLYYCEYISYVKRWSDWTFIRNS